MELGYTNPLTYPEALRTPHHWDFMEASSGGPDGALAQSPAPFPSQRMGESGVESLKLLVLAWSSW